MHNYDETKGNSYIQYLVFNKQYGWTLSQSLPYARFDHAEGISIFTHDCIINYDKKRDFD